MSRRNRYGRRRDKLGTYGAGKTFLMLYDEVKTHDSYQFLTHAQRLILQEFIYRHNKASNGDTEKPKPFAFTWENCRESVGKTAFYEAMETFKVVGWLRVSKNSTSGLCTVLKYEACERWRSFDPMKLSDNCKLKAALIVQWTKFQNQMEVKRRTIQSDKTKKSQVRDRLLDDKYPVPKTDSKVVHKLVVPELRNTRIPRAPRSENGSLYPPK